MATFLYRLGRLAFRRRGRAVLLWAAALVAVAVGGLSAPGTSDGDLSMPGIESQHAYDLVQQRFPGAAADGATAQVVFVAPGGEKVTAAGNRAAVEHAVAALAGGPQVAGVADPFTSGAVSKDGSTAYATVDYTVAADDLTGAARGALDTAADQARAEGLTVETGGSALDADEGPGGTSELIGIAVAAVVLLVTFGSLTAAGMPLLTAIAGAAVSLFGILLLGHPLGLTSDTLTLGMMLGLAVGIDYALFVISRYREERGRGHSPQEAAGRAVGTAGSAVVFAGLTVVIALAGLSVVGIPVLTKMGLAAAGAVGVAVLVALTLVPALLGFRPDAVLGRRARKAPRVRENLGSRWARFVLRRPVAVLVSGVLGLGALAVPVASLHLGSPGDEALSTSTTQRRAYDDLAHGFGPGFNGPLTIVVDAKGAPDPRAAVHTIGERIGKERGIVSVSPPTFDKAGETAVFSATPATSPTDTRTKELVRTVRGERPAIESGTSATFQVTGTTALNIDIAGKVQGALVPYLATVVGLAVVLLLVVFRSVLVPLKAALGFVLSVLAALGLVVLVFQQGHGAGLLGVQQTGPVMSLMPIFMVGIVFGLAMDYEVFLLSRVREAYAQGEDARHAVVSGFRHSARVVVAAALIMIAVFSGFVEEQGSMIKMVGFGLAAAVLLDAFVVRMAIVPAVLALLGDRAWWLPRWLDRLLPHVDIEGESLAHRPRSVPGAGHDPDPRADAPERAGV
ncbi:MMPL family transporter [Streptomyces sp. NRRL F-5123]|uniref:MMPL family transporter n=1 Tax=Streptomyces sp. NRRL F-5123 TaxID=1463856 RepID=UPI0005BDFBA1|nr:MMPL family transporter [Streptomyces sp. NRRL F-5123]